MMKRVKLPLGIAATGLLGLFILSGCCTQQSPSGGMATAQAAPAPEPTPAPAPMPQATGCGKSERYEENGMTYIKTSMPFPTGNMQSSGVLLEKVVPAEVLVGQPFAYEYRVINLTDCTLHDVVVSDFVTEIFRPENASPEPIEVAEGMARWKLGDMGPRETATIIANGTAREEGIITTCGYVTYIPILCEEIRVVKADLQLVKTAPAEVLLCDNIPMTLVVKNTGSSALSGVRVVDTLPAGLTSDGRSELAFDVGTLAPGDSRELNFNARASSTGEYRNVAKATSAQGVQAEDSATTVVRQPVLTLACDMPNERFVGRPIVACFTVSNTGDAPSTSTVVEAPLPSGVNYTGSTADGSLSGSTVVWRIPSLAPGDSREVCAQLVGTQVGTVRLTATARGTCATPVTSTCSTVVTGIPAILLEVIDVDDPLEVGGIETYVITVTNQGSAPDTNIRVTCEFEAEQEFAGGEGATAVSGSGQSAQMAPLASLAPKAQASWKVRVKALSAANVRAKFIMISDQLTRPVEETESTNQY